MFLTPDEEATRTTYDAMAAHWAQTERESLFWQPELDTFKKLVPAGSKILEVGAADGRYAPHFARAGYRYTGVDFSPKLVAVARRDHPGMPFSVQNVCDLTFTDSELFDAFWAAAVLLHIPKSKLETALQRLRAVVRPNAVGLITLRQGKTEDLRIKNRPNGTQDKRYFAYYEPDEFRKLLAQSGLEQIQMSSDSKRDTYTWLSFFVRAV